MLDGGHMDLGSGSVRARCVTAAPSNVRVTAATAGAKPIELPLEQPPGSWTWATVVDANALEAW